MGKDSIAVICSSLDSRAAQPLPDRRPLGKGGMGEVYIAEDTGSTAGWR